MTSIETIEKSFSPIQNIISQYNIPVYSVIFSVKKYCGKPITYHQVVLKRESAIDFILTQIEKIILDILKDYEEWELMEQKLSTYYTEKTDSKEIHFRIKDEFRNENCFEEIMDEIYEYVDEEETYRYSISEPLEIK